jgi:hypothetical protein
MYICSRRKVGNQTQNFCLAFELTKEKDIMNQRKIIRSFILIISLLFLTAGKNFAIAQDLPGGFVSVSSIGAENLTITVQAGEYQITSGNKGQRIEMEGFGYLMVPGKPLLPAKSFLIALPPGARVQSVEVKGTGATQLPGTYRIMPTPPILPVADPLQYSELVEKMQREWQKNREAVYSTDQAYPKERGKLSGSGTLRKYSYASVSFYPFSYHPQSGRLIYYDAAQIIVNYSLPSLGSSDARMVEELRWDTLADEKASRLFVNYQQIEELYQPTGLRPTTWTQTHEYVIITVGYLLSAITSSDFLDWKASLGYNTRIVLTTGTEIGSQLGVDLAERIRNFLRNYYIAWGIEYVLLVGNYVAVPMRYCYPDSSNHTNGAGDPSAWPWSGDVPTDYYYADLSDPDAASWDSDDDGFCGEYGQDSPDFLADVYVGRIPTSNSSRITYTLNKLVTFEQDTGAWKQRALHAGAIAYFANEDYSGRELSDGASILDSIETDIMGGWTISHYSEQAGLAPSAYDWPALSEATFIGDWRDGQYGVVNWSAHGWSNRVARKVWSWDDGDGVPESNEMSWPDFISISSNLDDDYPSIVFAISCLVGYPEPNAWGNLGIDLLTEPSFGSSVGIVSGTRVVWVSKGGGELLGYEFNRYLIDGPGGPERVGDALYDSKFFCNQNYTWNHYSEYWNMFCYNLYGDPSLVREGTEPTALCGDANGDQEIDIADVVHVINYLFISGPPPQCNPITACGDVNLDGEANTADAVYLINYLFINGPEPCNP